MTGCHATWQMAEQDIVKPSNKIRPYQEQRFEVTDDSDELTD